MKKALPIIIAVVAVAAILVSCIILFTGGNKEGDKTPESIALTTENIDQYIAIEATYNGYREYQRWAPGLYWGECNINLQAYMTKPGTLSDVEITVLASVPNDAGDPGEYPWCPLDGEKGDPVQFTFRLSTTGEYQKTYAIECNGPSSDLRGNCDLTIISVTGTFIPAN